MQTPSSCPPRASPAVWHRWSPAATVRLPSSARPAACATPSTTAPWVTATALPLPVTTPTSCMWPAATHRMPTTTRKTGRTSCVTAWSAISAGTFPPRATRVCTTRPQTSGKRLNPKAPAGAAAQYVRQPLFCFFFRFLHSAQTFLQSLCNDVPAGAQCVFSAHIYGISLNKL